MESTLLLFSVSLRGVVQKNVCICSFYSVFKAIFLHPELQQVLLVVFILPKRIDPVSSGWLIGYLRQRHVEQV